MSKLIIVAILAIIIAMYAGDRKNKSFIIDNVFKQDYNYFKIIKRNEIIHYGFRKKWL